jgi:ribosomal protein L4
MLSAKLAEQKLGFLDSEKIDLSKTKILSHIFKDYKENRLLILTGMDACNNFMKAQQNLKYIECLNPQQLNVTSLLANDIVLITK